MQACANARHVIECELAVRILGSFGKLRLRVLGSSMVPSVFPRDILTIERAEAGEIRPGEIVLFRRKARLVVHRAIERHSLQGRLCWKTRGDALGACDPPVCGEELLGRVVAIRRGGHVLSPPALRGFRLLVVGAVRRSNHLARAVVRLEEMLTGDL